MMTIVQGCSHNRQIIIDVTSELAGAKKYTNAHVECELCGKSWLDQLIYTTQCDHDYVPVSISIGAYRCIKCGELIQGDYADG